MTTRRAASRLFRAALVAAFLCVVCFWATLPPLRAFAVPPKYFILDNPRVEIASGDIRVLVGVDFDNITGLFEMLKDGAAVELVASVVVERVRVFWTNVLVSEAEFVSPLEHNPLTREFSIQMPGMDKPLLDKRLDRLLAATWKKLEMDLGPLSQLEKKDTEYRVTLALALRHAKVPPWLARNFMFWSRNVTETETVKLYFTY